MPHVFLDESGDLGFSERSSYWFILSIVLTDHHRQVEKCIKRVHRGLRKQHRTVKELHAYHSDKITRKRVLRLLAAVDDLSILCIVLNKQKVYIDLRNQKNYLYNYSANILLDRLKTKKAVSQNDPLTIILDQQVTNKFMKKNFEQYLSRELNRRGQHQFHIAIRQSHTEKCLQAVDFISWALFRKYERGDYEYYEIIKHKIIEENLLFP